MRARAAFCLAAVLPLAGGCGKAVLVSRGTTVPLELQRMGGDDLHEYFKASGGKGYKDGSRLEVSAVMVDLAYLKATGQTLEATDEEMEALTSRKRFEVHVEYTTHNVFPGANEGEGISADRWTITLTDSTGTELSPSSTSFEPPLIQKAATEPGPILEQDASRLIMTYILKGHVIFEYQVPEGCKWIELALEPPLTGHVAGVRWSVAN
jgi:hypothetical protein